MSEQLRSVRAAQDKAKADAASAEERLEAAATAAARVPGLEAGLAEAQAGREAAEAALGEAQAAVKLLMAAVEEKAEALERAEEQLAEAQRAAEAARRGREEAAKEAAERGACADALRAELRAVHEEASGWQQRARAAAAEGEGRNLEVARRELKIKASDHRSWNSWALGGRGEALPSCARLLWPAWPLSHRLLAMLHLLPRRSLPRRCTC